MRRRVLAMLAGLGLVTLSLGVIGAGTAQAATPVAQSPVVTSVPCEFPDDQLEALTKVAKVDAQEELSGDLLENVLKCLRYTVVDKCDGTTVVTAVNWAVSDNKRTRLTFMVQGKDYTVIGGPDHTPTIVTLGPPGVVDVQVYLVFEGTKNGTHWRIEVPLLRTPYSWHLPDACPTASPTPSPSAVPTTAAPSTTKPVVAPNDNPDLPVTGAALSGTLWTGTGLMLVVAGIIVFLAIRRRREATASGGNE